MRSRFLWKLYGSSVLLILVTTAIVGLLVSRQVQRDSLAELEATLRDQALLLRQLVSDEQLSAARPELQRRLRELGAQTSVRFTLVAVDGVVTADSAEDATSMDNHGLRPEIVAARREGIGTATRHSTTMDREMLYLALAVRRDTVLRGFVRTSLPLTFVDQRLAHVRRPVLAGAAAAVLVGLLLGLFFARRVTRPLLSMTRVAESLAAGQYESEVRVESRDEIGALAAAFNHMAGELRRRVATLDNQRSELETVLAGMVEGVVALTARQQVMYLNGAAASMLGIDAQLAVDRPLWELVRLPAILEAVRGVIDEGHPGHQGVADLAGRAVQIRAAPIRDGGAVLVLYDVTELKRLEVVRRDFVANVSHELKTPVTAIAGLVETILDDAEMPAATSHRFLQQVRSQARRLSTLVTDLLTLSRLESGAGRLEHGGAVAEREVVDLREAVRESLQSQVPDAEAKGIALSTVLTDEAVEVEGDRESLRDAIDNLLSNAIRYTPPGGRVVVKLYRSGRDVTVEVKDTGPGIGAEHHERIFERFYRVDTARSRELGGTGLGLAIVKHIAMAHGGSVGVDSVPGSGSTFAIRLPSV